MLCPSLGSLHLQNCPRPHSQAEGRIPRSVLLQVDPPAHPHPPHIPFPSHPSALVVKLNASGPVCVSPPRSVHLPFPVQPHKPPSPAPRHAESQRRREAPRRPPGTAHGGAPRVGGCRGRASPRTVPASSPPHRPEAPPGSQCPQPVGGLPLARTMRRGAGRGAAAVPVQRERVRGNRRHRPGHARAPGAAGLLAAAGWARSGPAPEPSSSSSSAASRPGVARSGERKARCSPSSGTPFNPSPPRSGSQVSPPGLGFSQTGPKRPLPVLRPDPHPRSRRPRATRTLLVDPPPHIHPYPHPRQQDLLRDPAPQALCLRGAAHPLQPPTRGTALTEEA